MLKNATPSSTKGLRAKTRLSTTTPPQRTLTPCVLSLTEATLAVLPFLATRLAWSFSGCRSQFIRLLISTCSEKSALFSTRWACLANSWPLPRQPIKASVQSKSKGIAISGLGLLAGLASIIPPWLLRQVTLSRCRSFKRLEISGLIARLLVNPRPMLRWLFLKYISEQSVSLLSSGTVHFISLLLLRLS